MATQQLRPAERPEIVYPESDGQPMADNTLQFEWIVTIKGNLDALFRDDPEVFVAGDLLWYPVEGDNRTRVAPDVLVAFGRPKGYRGAYLQWQEAGIAPQVVFEILSPGNRLGEMLRKRDFYERFGVEEYYLYDPDRFDLTGWRRAAEGTGGLRVLETASAWTSPRLGIRFEVAEGEPMVIYGPGGRRFLTFVELEAERQRAEHERQRAEAERDQARQRAERLAERLRSAGIDPEGE
jgi:Uma2 family endonuclease